jgi:competence protein ComEC
METRLGASAGPYHQTVLGWPIHLSILASALGVHCLSVLAADLMWSLLAIAILAFVVALFLSFYFRQRSIFVLCIFCIGASAANASLVVYRALDRVQAKLAPELDGLTIGMTGVVNALPTQYEQGQSFHFLVEGCQGINASLCPLGRIVRLSWFLMVPKKLLPGQRWQLSAQLKLPHARLNPYLFDAELRMFEEGVVATGSVHNRLDSPAILKADLLDTWRGFPWWIERARHQLRSAIERGLDSTARTQVQPSEEKMARAVRGVLVALVVGDQGAIPSSWWEVFNQSGVGHLMSISGLHVTMMAGSAGAAAVLLWQLLVRFLPNQWLCYLPAKQTWRWLFGVSGAWAYTAIAGFGIPAQRTCWMVTLAAISILTGRSTSACSVILFTATAVVLLDPWSVLSAGFWLSFGAVSAIIYFGSAPPLRRGERAPVAVPKIATESAVEPKTPSTPRRAFDTLNKWFVSLISESWQSQVAATLVLLPIGAAFFASFALLSPVSNAVAIPIVSAVVTPLAIVGALLNALQLPWLGSTLLVFGAYITEPLLEGLRWLAALPGSVAIIGKPSIGVLAVSFLGLLITLVPIKIIPITSRWAGILALTPLLVQAPEKPEPGQVWLTAFDVGQGMAVLIETHNRRLLFDTGSRQGSETNSGASLIAPYLRARGLARIDALVVSHLDDDHSGGVPGILKYVDIGWIATSVAFEHPMWEPLLATKHKSTKQITCQSGQRWKWDDIEFEFLHPAPAEKMPALSAKTEKVAKNLANSKSCVLRVASRGGVAILAGDVELAQEKLIVAAHLAQGTSNQLKTDVLLVPNHGNISSSSIQWLAATQPKVAIFQVGYRNRFKLPHKAVLQRYVSAGALILRSDEQGAVRLTLPKEASDHQGDTLMDKLQLRAMRVDSPPYWRTKLVP